MDNHESSEGGRCNMSIVNLVSGGLDSTLISVLMREEGIDIFRLIVK